MDVYVRKRSTLDMGCSALFDDHKASKKQNNNEEQQIIIIIIITNLIEKYLSRPLIEKVLNPPTSIAFSLS